MRFTVPKFDDIEDKVVGPLTFKQAAYVIGATVVFIALFMRVGFVLAFIIGLPFYALAGALAFLKVNERPFSYFLYSLSFFSIRKKLYLWKKESEEKKEIKKQKEDERNTISEKEKLHIRTMAERNTQSRLKELAWSLDSNEDLNKNNTL
jgi:hypothetical protein